MSTGRVLLALAKGTGAGAITGLSMVGAIEMFGLLRGVVENYCPDPASRLITDGIIMGAYGLMTAPVWSLLFYHRSPSQNHEDQAIHQTRLSPTDT
jgi:hypothetical protein